MAFEEINGPGLLSPSLDLAELIGQLGQASGVSCGYPIAQYLAWGESTGIFELLARCGALSIGEICSATELRESGADALLGVFTSLRVVSRRASGEYALTELAREYFLPRSPYYAGESLFVSCVADVPDAFLRNRIYDRPSPRLSWSVERRLKVQHGRNFAPAVVAARSGQFEGIRHVVDIGGGSGVLAIPLAMDYPELQITILEQPEVLAPARKFLARYGMENRVHLIGMDIYSQEWQFGSCDGVFFGNVLHSATDRECRFLCRNSFEVLSPGGRIWLHEVLFNEARDGPLMAALWNANMAAWKPGAHQRTARELCLLLEDVGFVDGFACPTAGGFSLVSAFKPQAVYQEFTGMKV